MITVLLKVLHQTDYRPVLSYFRNVPSISVSLVYRSKIISESTIHES